MLIMRNHQLFTVLTVLLGWFAVPVPAPFPRCSPFILVNKIAEFTTILSDLHPYYPVQPCEYGGPVEALSAGDLKSVLLSADPLFPKHVLYEIIWLVKTGIPRVIRTAIGQEKFQVDLNILTEGHKKHYTRNPRKIQLGHGTYRRPEIIDNPRIYDKVIQDKLNKLVKEGFDSRPTSYTPQGPLKRSESVRSEYRSAPPSSVQPSVSGPARSAVAPAPVQTSVPDPARAPARSAHSRSHNGFRRPPGNSNDPFLPSPRAGRAGDWLPIDQPRG